MEKKKKKLGSFHKYFFNQFIFTKALQNYFKGVRILSYMALQLGLLPQRNDPETYRYRYENRFKIFSKVYYLKYLTFDDYMKEQTEFLANLEPESIKSCSAQVKKIFQDALETLKLLPITNDDSIDEKLSLRIQSL